MDRMVSRLVDYAAIGLVVAYFWINFTFDSLRDHRHGRQLVALSND
jgi:hypothetical protein